MTNIKLNELQPDDSKQPKGSELFEDRENYLDDLSEDELNVRGGADDSIIVNDSGTISVDNRGGDIDVSISTDKAAP